MAKKICIITLCLSSLLTGISFAQSHADVSLMRRVYPGEVPRAEYEYAKDNRNEIHALFAGLFLGYKSFISSQDSKSCSFHPSCSEYGMEAFKKQGPFAGTVNTLDRLSRCHGLNAYNYDRDPETGLLIDPL
jgi:uncharacterized protein